MIIEIVWIEGKIKCENRLIWRIVLIRHQTQLVQKTKWGKFWIRIYITEIWQTKRIKQAETYLKMRSNCVLNFHFTTWIVIVIHFNVATLTDEIWDNSRLTGRNQSDLIQIKRFMGGYSTTYINFLEVGEKKVKLITKGFQYKRSYLTPT